MDATKQKCLEDKGWKIGSMQEFLRLTDVEYAEIAEAVENKLSATITTRPGPPAPPEHPPTSWGE